MKRPDKDKEPEMECVEFFELKRIEIEGYKPPRPEDVLSDHENVHLGEHKFGADICCCPGCGTTFKYLEMYGSIECPFCFEEIPIEK